MYDLIIIGCGPAGMSAAIYAARRKLNFVVITMTIGGQVEWTHEVDNYLGFNKISGQELVERFHNHLKEYNVPIQTNEEVSKVWKEGNIIKVKTNQREYEAKCVLVTAGKHPKELGIQGEKEFFGKGVSYTMSEHAHLYDGKTVAVVGGGNTAMEDVLHLKNHAQKTYIITITKDISGETVLVDQVKQDPQVEIIPEATVTKIMGATNVQEIEVKKGEETKHYNVEALFIDIGLVPKTDFVDCEKNQKGEIVIKKNTDLLDQNSTSIPGVFAAGDITDTPMKQISVAVGQGSKAALAAFIYIARWKG